jgi:hypothetical protein
LIDIFHDPTKQILKQIEIFLSLIYQNNFIEIQNKVDLIFLFEQKKKKEEQENLQTKNKNEDVEQQSPGELFAEIAVSFKNIVEN